MPEENAIYLGFDYGTKRIGIAVGQALTQTASPLMILKVADGVPDWEQLDRLIKEWCPSGLVVGIPYNMNHTMQSITAAAQDFATKLQERYHLPVYGMDERLSTKDAKERVFAQGGYKALKKSYVDSIAAVLILESWLNKSKS